jgi:tRNA-2-methylthio-N6-dimethylallyladenosine synthase
MQYFIITFGCQQNIADSQRFAGYLKEQGLIEAASKTTADQIIINTCIVRQSAEDRIYGQIANLAKLKKKNPRLKIILTGCLVGLAYKDKSGLYLKTLQTKLPEVDEFIPIEEIGFNYSPLNHHHDTAYVPISNGCNNFCSYCVVPYSRGQEISRPYHEIIQECKKLKEKGTKNILLLGQNVNSYGADIVKTQLKQKDPNLKKLTPIYVNHLGKKRLPTLFPYLLQEIAEMGFLKIDFLSANPWDFSEALIEVIANHKNITRLIHLPVQSGDNKILKKMNRWYTHAQYLKLVEKIRQKIPEVEFTTDIIVGFPGETDTQFKNTVKLCRNVGFKKAYIARYSPRPFTLSANTMPDDVPALIKKQRWEILNNLINKKNKC